MVADSETGEATERLPGEFSIDAVLSLFAERRRRLAVSCLEQHEEALSLADLAEDIAIEETDASRSDIDRQDVSHVYLNLYHNHVPRLEDHGIVEYEQERGLIRLSEGTDPVLEILTDVTDAFEQ